MHDFFLSHKQNQATLKINKQKRCSLRRGRAGHLFNPSHGLTPAAKLENIAALVDTVRSFK